jgi:hypothetical protein
MEGRSSRLRAKTSRTISNSAERMRQRPVRSTMQSRFSPPLLSWQKFPSQRHQSCRKRITFAPAFSPARKLTASAPTYPARWLTFACSAFWWAGEKVPLKNWNGPTYTTGTSTCAAYTAKTAKARASRSDTGKPFILQEMLVGAVGIEIASHHS